MDVIDLLTILQPHPQTLLSINKKGQKIPTVKVSEVECLRVDLKPVLSSLQKITEGVWWPEQLTSKLQ